MGFNAMQPGKVKRADVAIFLVALGVIAALLVWVLL
jgi:hypothetical protein